MGCRLSDLPVDRSAMLKILESEKAFFLAFSGYANMEGKWIDLEYWLMNGGLDIFKSALEKCSKVEELSQNRYSMVLLCFDHPWSVGEFTARETVMIEMMRMLFEKALTQLDNIQGQKVQPGLALFFFYIGTLPALARNQIVGNDTIPVLNVHATPEPSKIHQRLFVRCEEFLRKEGIPLTVEVEFDGLGIGLYHMDMVLKRGEQIIGFIEVDGSQHFRGQRIEAGGNSGGLGEPFQRRRKDLLKEFLYRHKYPGVPLKRIELFEEKSFSTLAKNLEQIVVEFSETEENQEKE